MQMQQSSSNSGTNTHEKYEQKHYDYGREPWRTFHEIRQRHNENICHETNKLLLRLDKLINEAPQDNDSATFMRDHEKSVVDWTSDEIVKLCPYCAKSFHPLSRRRHHCRLCGAVMCNSCSLFLQHESACKLIRPTNIENSEEETAKSSSETNRFPKIRLCNDCKRLLDKRIQSIEDHYYHPFFCDFYEKLRSKITTTNELLELYDNICDSLKMGEEDYKIQDAQELRTKLEKHRETIAYMAKNITTLAAANNEKEAQFLTAIRHSIGFWVKKNELLSTFPTAEEYEILKQERRRQMDEQVLTNHESPVNLGQSQTTNKRGRSRWSAMRKSATTGDGLGSSWVSDQPQLDATEEEVNPLLMQIRNIEEYIKQARNASRYEEVATLEANKRDLEIEFLIQQGIDN